MNAPMGVATRSMFAAKLSPTVGYREGRPGIFPVRAPGSVSGVVDAPLVGVPKPICSDGVLRRGASLDSEPGSDEPMPARSTLTPRVPERPEAPVESCAATATLFEPKSCETTAPKLIVSEVEEPPVVADTARTRLWTTAFLSGVTSSLGPPLIEPPPVSFL